MTDTQPEALRLADELETEFAQGRISNHTGRKAATELRRLHAENETLRARCVEPAGEYPALPEIKDMHNGPQQLNLSDRAMWVLGWNECRDAARDADRAMRTAQPASAAAAAQEPVAVPRFNCWSTNEGDSWFDHPADSQAIYDCLGNNAKVGDEYELTAGWKSVTARYRITEVVGDGEEYEVECISHPQENTAPPPSTTAQGDALDAERLDWLTFNLSGKALRDIGVVWSEHGDARRAIDAARAAQEGK